ncbi:MAG: hypothetical protein CME62_03090 [Halobacteriovoraceae bacterium]|nr:hypothetical protein [Halobacteriovoraceae bacterium]|tara:strand:- start:2008 stop:3300 length:1293 start_codon:yes stop_codon:yes gene_type:complete
MSKPKDFKNNAYCPLAWIHSFVNQDGSYQVCCTSEEFENHIVDDEGNKIFVTSGKSVQEVMNTQFMKKTRKDMLDGKWPSFCSRCEYAEKSGGVSRREVEIKNYQEHNSELIQKTDEDGTSHSKVLSADYRLGNLCNLQCRMCNPRSTAMWIKEWNQIKPEREHFSEERMESYKNYTWIDSEHLVRDFNEKAPNLSHIHFAGGEPLIVPQMRKVLEKCIESGNAKNITITYNTNLMKLPENVINLWPHFKNIKILASIDAVGSLNDYIRYPSKWHIIDKNLKFIDQHHEEYNISECMISSTVQILNVLKLDELYEYLEQFNFIVAAPNLVNLIMPYYFQTTNLPKPLKIMAKLKLLEMAKKYENKVEPYHKYLLDNITQIINFMEGTDGFAEGNFNTFLEFQTKFDQSRGISLFDLYPSFKSFIPVEKQI